MDISKVVNNLRITPELHQVFKAKLYERVYSAGKNFTGRINPALILLVKLKFLPVK